MTAHIAPEAIDAHRFRALMRSVASSVAVITTGHDGHLHGMTATAVCSVSASPPRLLIVVNRSARSHPLITASRNFTVNVLAEAQRELSERFASGADNQFTGVPYDLAGNGSPVIRGAAAHMECILVSETEMGTHTIFVGEIIGGGMSGASPLLYHDGAYKALTPRVSQYDIAPLFLERWSPRAFTDETISAAQLMPLLEAARWAPSSMNAQPWRFVYLLRGGAGWRETLGCLSNTNQSWAFRAAALIAFVSKDTLEFGAETAPSPTHSFDAGAAWMSFALQAYLSGWHTHGMAGFDPVRLRAVLAVPDGYVVNAIAAIGKIGDRSLLEDKLKTRESPAGRAPLEELVFEERMRIFDSPLRTYNN
ncbi:flavin reductase [Terrarubrum flagellatum]|uniref:flavin reductase n=1 Tax=Terrirubrum flagellatum TaxID=2895980 RepID=UPI003145555B